MEALVKDTINVRGRAISVQGLQIGDKQVVIVQRGLLSIARLKDEWFEDVGDPELILNQLAKSQPTPDLFTFWQRLPDTVPAYSYYKEEEALSAVPLKDFDHWWKTQINSDARKKAKRAEKRGVELRTVTLDDNLVRGVMGIFNDSPIRQGKPFWHYGKSFEDVKEILSRGLGNSKFLAAYHDAELVGIAKLNYAGQRFVNPGLFLSKLDYRREKYLDNALIAKSIEICTADGVAYFTYADWRRGNHAEFLRRNGFEKTVVPRYWIPLTTKGRLAMGLGLHRELRNRLPDWLYDALLDMRAKYYSAKFKVAAEGE